MTHQPDADQHSDRTYRSGVIGPIGPMHISPQEEGRRDARPVDPFSLTVPGGHSEPSGVDPWIGVRCSARSGEHRQTARSRPQEIGSVPDRLTAPTKPAPPLLPLTTDPSLRRLGTTWGQHVDNVGVIGDNSENDAWLSPAIPSSSPNRNTPEPRQNADTDHNPHNPHHQQQPPIKNKKQ